MRKTKLVKIILICFGLFTILNLFFKPIKAESNEFFIKLDGWWFTEKFIADIKETKSYQLAVKRWENGKNEINNDESGYTDLYLYNYNNNDYCQIGSPFYGHNRIVEKVNSLSDKQFGLVFQKDFNDKINGKCILTIDDLANPTKIVCEYKGKTYSFLKLKDSLEVYINRVTLVGTYKDDLGKTYTFGENENANWPDKTFKYEVYPDAIWSAYDYFVNDNNKNPIYYCYEWKNENLYIYNGHSEGQGKIFKDDLIVVLKKTPSPTTSLPIIKENLLTLDYAKNYHQYPGGKELSQSEQHKQISEANSLSDEGFNYYKSKKDNLAIAKYEEALTHYASAEIYYRYGNSLSNIPRLEDAVKAYQIAIELNYDKPGLVYYNIACVYSRMNQGKEAFTNLELAINNGYKNFDHIQQDEDLVWLRSQPEWKDWWGKHQQ